MTVEVIEVVRTTLKTAGDGDAVPIHRHEQFWSLDGELLSENCTGGYCTTGSESAEKPDGYALQRNEY